jgi:hypothetical protein
MTDTKDRLAEIRDWLKNHEPHPPFAGKALRELLDEAERRDSLKVTGIVHERKRNV